MKRILTFLVLAIALLFSSCNSNSTVIPPHTVTFDSKEGSYTPRVQYVKDGETAIEPKSPTKSDTFGFRRWRVDGGKEEAFDFNTPIKSDITLWAEYWPIKENDDVRKLTYSMSYYWNIIRTVIENENFAKGETVEKAFAYTGDRKSDINHSKNEKDLAYILANAIALKDDAGNSFTLAYYNEKEEEEYSVNFQTDNDFSYEIHSGTKCEKNSSTVETTDYSGTTYNIDIQNFKIELYGYKPGEFIDASDGDGEYTDQKEPFDNTFTSVISLKGTVKKTGDPSKYKISMAVKVDDTEVKNIEMGFEELKDSKDGYVISFYADGLFGNLIYRM